MSILEPAGIAALIRGLACIGTTRALHFGYVSDPRPAATSLRWPEPPRRAAPRRLGRARIVSPRLARRDRIGRWRLGAWPGAGLHPRLSFRRAEPDRHLRLEARRAGSLPR